MTQRETRDSLENRSLIPEEFRGRRYDLARLETKIEHCYVSPFGCLRIPVRVAALGLIESARKRRRENCGIGRQVIELRYTRTRYEHY